MLVNNYLTKLFVLINQRSLNTIFDTFSDRHYLQSGKGTQRQAADIFQVSLAAVKKIWKRYKEEGIRALQNKKRGPAHSTARLSREQIKEVTQCIKKGTPDSYQLPYYLWTADAVRLLIKKKQR